jgi:hypothetical protein
MRFPRRLRGLPAAAALLGAAMATFLGALTVPIPAVPDATADQMIDTIEQRLPGWDVERIGPSWEGAYTVVTACADETVSFQLIPGHGLPEAVAWVRPGDERSHRRLVRVSDHDRYLVWFEEHPAPPQLACIDDVAHELPGEPLARLRPNVD